MKCDKCFFCAHIGKGIFADYPVKFCKHQAIYIAPFVTTYENGKPTIRELDFSKSSDCKIWHEMGCNIHPNTVKKAKKKFLKSLEVDK